MTSPRLAQLDTIPVTRLDQSTDRELLEELLEVVDATSRRAGAFTFGTELEAFEEEFAAYCETAHAVGVSSGTEAIVARAARARHRRRRRGHRPDELVHRHRRGRQLVGATPRFIDVDRRLAPDHGRGRRGRDRPRRPAASSPCT